MSNKMSKMSYLDCLNLDCEHLREGDVTTGSDDICDHNGCLVWDVCVNNCPKMQEVEGHIGPEDDPDSFEMAILERDFELFVDLFEARVSAPSTEEGIKRVDEMIQERCG